MSTGEQAPAPSPQPLEPRRGPDRRYRLELVSDAAHLNVPNETWHIVLVLPDEQIVNWTADALEASGFVWVNGWKELEGNPTVAERMNTAEVLELLAESLTEVGSGPIPERAAGEARRSGAR